MIHKFIASITLLFFQPLYALSPSPLDPQLNPQLLQSPSFQPLSIVQESLNLKSTYALLSVLTCGGTAGVFVAAEKKEEKLREDQAIVNLAKRAKKLKKRKAVTSELPDDEEEQTQINHFFYHNLVGSSAGDVVKTSLVNAGKDLDAMAIPDDEGLSIRNKKVQLISSSILRNSSDLKENNALKLKQGNTLKGNKEIPFSKLGQINTLTHEIEDDKYLLLNSEQSKKEVISQLADLDEVSQTIQSELVRQGSTNINPFESDKKCHGGDHQLIKKLKEQLATVQMRKECLEEELNQIRFKQRSLQKSISDKEDEVDRLICGKDNEISSLNEQMESYKITLEREKQQAAADLSSLNTQLIGLHLKEISSDLTLSYKEQELDKLNKERENFKAILRSIAEQMGSLKAQNKELNERNNEFLLVNEKRYQEKISQLQENMHKAEEALTHKAKEILEVIKEKNRAELKSHEHFLKFTDKEKKFKELEVKVDFLQREVEEINEARKASAKEHKYAMEKADLNIKKLKNEGFLQRDEYTKKEKYYLNTIDELKAEKNTIDQFSLRLEKKLEETKHKLCKSKDDFHVITQELQGLVDNYRNRINILAAQPYKKINLSTAEIESRKMTIEQLTVRLSEKERTIEALTKMNQLADKQITVAIKQAIDEALNWWDDVDAGKKGVEKGEVVQECLGEDIIKRPVDGKRAEETKEKLTTEKEQIISTLKNLNTQVSNYLNNENESYQKEVDGVHQIRQGSIDCRSSPSVSGQSCD